VPFVPAPRAPLPAVMKYIELSKSPQMAESEQMY
jgi:hypothetical protein